MAEHSSIEEGTSHSGKGSKPSTTSSTIFNAYLVLSSLCALAALVVASISLHTANEFKAFKSSHFTTDLERTFNSTVYAIMPNTSSDATLFPYPAAKFVTGQTSIPGQCVTVADSQSMLVSRLAPNCSPYAYAQENCAGQNLIAPMMPVGVSGFSFVFKSFQILCT